VPGSLSVRGSFRPEQCRTLLTSLAKQHIQEEIAHKKVGYRLTAIAPVLYSSRYNLLSAGSGRGGFGGAGRAKPRSGVAPSERTPHHRVDVTDAPYPRWGRFFTDLQQETLG